MTKHDQSSSQENRTNPLVKTIVFTLLLSPFALLGWMALKLSQTGLLQGLLRDSTQFTLSRLQVEVAIAGLVGLLATVLVQARRRSKSTKTRPLRMTAMTFGKQEQSHPLMRTPRPARDKNFVIKKTRNRGRILRNRMGERLPPSYVTEPEFEAQS